MMKMVKPLSFLPLIFFSFFIISSQSRSITSTLPHPLKSFNIKPLNQTAASTCSYTVTIKTSCSSPSYTRDRVSLAYGDAYGNEVHAQRLDNPSARIFERCSTDVFQIRGPCTYEICYVYLLRVGSDGWKPEFVKIAGQRTRGVTFKYNTFVPNGVWFGFNHCNGNGNGVSASL